MTSLRKIIPGAIAAAAVLALVGASPAQAEVRTGWIGPTPPVNGTIFLHTSTIDNGGVPIASSRIYTSFANVVSPGIMGAKARLFREGALCSATDYRFNALISNSQVASTQRDCGAGFYNSHGFVAVSTSRTAPSTNTSRSRPIRSSSLRPQLFSASQLSRRARAESTQGARVTGTR